MQPRASVSSKTAARREIEETVHVALYPGTEVMTDGSSMHVHIESKDLVLTVRF